MSTRNSGQRRGHRVERIERVIADVFTSTLLPLLEDPRLADLNVVHVEAASNLATVTVTVAPMSHASLGDTEEVKAALARSENFLRQELAATLRMKRVPSVRMCYLPLPLFGPVNGGEQ